LSLYITEEPPDNYVLVFVKFFDPETEETRYLGAVCRPVNSRVRDLLDCVRNVCEVYRVFVEAISSTSLCLPGEVCEERALRE
jgi:hypothetical protein